MAYLSAKALLGVVELLRHGTYALERLQQDTMLDALLHDALYIAIGITYFSSNLSHLPDIQATYDDKERYDDDDERGQSGLHRIKEDEGTHKARDNTKCGRQSLGDDARNVSSIAFKTVQYVARVAYLATFPFTGQQTTEEA